MFGRPLGTGAAHEAQRHEAQAGGCLGATIWVGIILFSETSVNVRDQCISKAVPNGMVQIDSDEEIKKN